MKYRTNIYNLLINHQASILELLRILDVKDPLNKVKNILDQQLFEILECSENEIIKIRKKSTGEVFERGCQFYHKKYKQWFENLWFDDSLFGVHYWEAYYKNYVRGNGGLYHLDDISLTDDSNNNLMLFVKGITNFKILNETITDNIMRSTTFILNDNTYFAREVLFNNGQQRDIHISKITTNEVKFKDYTGIYDSSGPWSPTEEGTYVHYWFTILHPFNFNTIN
jgi:hypothetical protein